MNSDSKSIHPFAWPSPRIDAWMRRHWRIEAACLRIMIVAVKAFIAAKRLIGRGGVRHV